MYKNILWLLLSDNLRECFDITIDNFISTGITIRLLHNHEPVFKIASINHRSKVRPVRVLIVEGRGGRTSWESAEGREENVAGGYGSGGKRTETAKEGGNGGRGSGGCGEGAREEGS
jgi:hypothetical protein